MGNPDIVPCEQSFCLATSLFQDNEFCKMEANKKLLMPFDLPPLPLCDFHAEIFDDWTQEDTIREFVEVMTEEQSIRNLMEDFDDDF